MDEIVPGLWIGDLACALSPEYLAQAGITHIITAMKQSIPPPIALPDGRSIGAQEMMHVRLDDAEDSPIIVYFPTANSFIGNVLEETWVSVARAGDKDVGASGGNDDQRPREDEVDPALLEERHFEGGSATPELGYWETRGQGSVLVHCHAGVSRSAAIVVAYLMQMRGIRAREALELVRRRRPYVEPNPGFMEQLELFETAGYQVDLRHQPVRRFLMSQTSILNGDSIDDVLLSYYPSPYPSPAASAKGLGGSIHMSSLESDALDLAGAGLGGTVMGRRRTSSSGSYGGAGGSASRSSHAPGRSPTPTSSSGHAPRRLTRPTSRSSLSSPDLSACGALDLSKSPPLPPDASTLLLQEPESLEANSTTRRSPGADHPLWSSISDPREVKVTLSSSNRLPGGIPTLRGVDTPSQARRLPKPQYAGPKLRCRMCRRELAAWDHLIEHQEGRGLLAFEMKKQRKEASSQRHSQGVAGPSGGTSGGAMAATSTSWAPSREAAQADRSPRHTSAATDGASPSSDLPKSHKGGEHVEGNGGAGADTPSQSSATSSSVASAGERRPIQSAASLTASLPPHLAALRLGKTQASPSSLPSAASPNPTTPLPARGASHEADPPPQPDAATGGASGAAAGQGTTILPRRIGLPSSRCTSFFVEPLAWMSALQGGEVAGRLDCPNRRCNAKLGSWDWAGMQCGCGAWITPAFALHRSKVDEA